MSSREHTNEVLTDALNRYRSGSIGRRQFLRTVGAVGVSSAVAAPLLAACAAEDDDADSEPMPEDEAGAADAQQGGTLVEGYDRDFNPLDPIRSPWADPAFNAVYEPLIVRDFNGELVPYLALSFTPGEEYWDLELPDDRVFHSGEPLTPEIVQTAYRQMMDPDTGQNPVFWGAVTDIETDANHVHVHLEHPSHAIGGLLATEFSYIPNVNLREEIGEEAFGAQQADGTGPFTLAEFAPGTRVLVERWDDYPGGGAPFFENSGPAHLDAIEWVPILEPSQRAAELETGAVQAVKNPVPADVPRLEANEDLVVLEFQELSNFALIPNMRRTELGFDDVRVRQAMSHAIDRQAIVGSILGGLGAATYGPVLPGWWFYEPGVEQFNAFDLDRADELLVEAGWQLNDGGVRERDGVTLEFTGINMADSIENQVMVSIAGMLAEVGIAMSVRSLEPAAFREQRGESDMFGQKWLWASPLDVVELFVTGWQPNDHPDVAESLASFERWNQATSDDDLEAGASEAQLALAQLLPMIPVYTPNTVWVHHRRVHGWRPNQANLYPFYNDVWIENE